MFNSPAAAWRVDRLVADLAAAGPATIVDIGCGLGELLRRVAAAVPGATAVGIDSDRELIERGRAAAVEQGLDGRVEFVEYRGEAWTEPADLVVCIGAPHVFGSSETALERLYPLVKPGGRLVFGDGFWTRVPTEAELATMWPDTGVSEWLLLPDLVDAAIGVGFRPVRIEAVEQSEWDDLESELAADLEVWLLANPGHPRADEVRARADRNRNWWLRGHRGLLGFAYLTLGRAR